MRLLILFITLLFFMGNVEAQLKPAQSQYLKETGFLINPGFEQGYKGWTIGGDCTKSLVSDIPYLNKSLKLTCINQSFSIKQETTEQTGLQGQQGSFGLQIKVNFDGTRVTELAGGARTSEIIVNSNASYQRLYTIPFILGSVSDGIEIFSDVNVTGEIIIDNVEFGLAPDGFVAQDLDDTPIGTVLAYGSETIPSGYLLADGTCYLKDGQYKQLFDVIGTSGGECTITAANDGFNVPDLRDQFLRGLTAGRTPFDTQADATAVNGLGTATDTHNHVSGVKHYTDIPFIYGAISVATGPGVSRVSSISNRQPYTSSDTHNHTVTSSDSETRPANKAVVYIIKAIGRPARNIVAQESLSPDKAGFIYFSATDGEITGFLKADGSCILESAYPDFIRNTGADTFGDCQAGPTPGDGSRLPDLVTNNRFIRAAGGSLAVGTTQTDLFGSHQHGVSGESAPVSDILGGSTANYGTLSTYNASATYIYPNYTSPVGGSETRPHNIALTPYVRMVDADIVRGSFEQIEEVKADLTKDTANNLTAVIDADTCNVISENYTGWVSTTDVADKGCSINYSNLALTTFPEVNTSASYISSGIYGTTFTIPSATSFTLYCVNRGTGAISTGCSRFYISLSKQGADVNKSFVGAVINASESAQEIADIVRKDIISSDLCQVNAEGGSSAANLNGGPISFTEVRDNCGAWDGDEYTAQKDGQLLISGRIEYTSFRNGTVSLYKNGSIFKNGLPQSDGATAGFPFSFLVDAQVGDIFYVSFNNSVTLLTGASVRYINITEIPDTASIVKNLNENNSTLCQTKYLTSDETADGPISELTFNNLTPGRKYKINSHIRALITVADAVTIRSTHDGNLVCYPIAGDNTGGSSVRTADQTCYFTATTTTLLHTSESITSGNSIQAGGNNGFTYVTLCELPDTFIIDSNKFD